MTFNVFGDYGVPITLKNDDDFLKVRETLTRIGIPSFNPEKSKTGKALIQTAHVLHKQGQYAIVHFKELFKLDGKDKYQSDTGEIRETIITDDDLARRNTIAFLLQDWQLIGIRYPEKIAEMRAPMSRIKVISHREKSEWELIAKHSLGRKRRKECSRSE